jgi:hypothetical protein
MKSLKVVVEFIRSMYGYIPCFSHSDFSDKVCPGFSAIDEYND